MRVSTLKSCMIRSRTDYIVFEGDMGVRGLDVALRRLGPDIIDTKPGAWINFDLDKK